MILVVGCKIPRNQEPYGAELRECDGVNQEKDLGRSSRHVQHGANDELIDGVDDDIYIDSSSYYLPNI